MGPQINKLQLATPQHPQQLPCPLLPFPPLFLLFLLSACLPAWLPTEKASWWACELIKISWLFCGQSVWACDWLRHTLQKTVLDRAKNKLNIPSKRAFTGYTKKKTKACRTATLIPCSVPAPSLLNFHLCLNRTFILLTVTELRL